MQHPLGKTRPIWAYERCAHFNPNPQKRVTIGKKNMIRTYKQQATRWAALLVFLLISAHAFIPAAAQEKGKIGELVTFGDGSKGVLVQVERDGQSGWAIALKNEGTFSWASQVGETATSALNKVLTERTETKRALNDMLPLLSDTAGYAATQAIRAAAGGNRENYPAAFAVDFDHGWYLPTAGQMFIVYALEPFIKKALEDNGGEVIAGPYWTSTPYNARCAWYLHAQLGVYEDTDGDGYKTKQYFVRAMRHWQASKPASTYTLAFDGNGATEGAMQPQTVNVGEPLTLPKNTFKRSGFEFLGWSMSSTATKASYTDEQAGVDLGGGKGEVKTLYAVWKATAAPASTYTLTFDGNGATEGTMQPQTVNVGESLTLPKNAFKRSGFEFLGWSISKNASTASYTDGQANVLIESSKGAVKTLYAVWKKGQTSTSVESALLSSAKSLVNPFRDRLTIVHLNAANRIEVYSILGEKLYDRELQGAERMEIATSEWESGLYIVRIHAKDGTKVLRVVKR